MSTDTLSNIESDLCQNWTGDKEDFERWILPRLANYIDARIAAANKPIVNIVTVSTMPCACNYKNGTFSYICETHKMAMRDMLNTHGKIV